MKVNKAVIAEGFKNMDLFGRRLNMLFNRQNYFKTYFGAVATMLLVLSITSATYYDVLKLFTYSIRTLNYYEDNIPIDDKIFNRAEFSVPKLKFAVLYKQKIANKSLMRLDYILDNFPDSARLIDCEHFWENGASITDSVAFGDAGYRRFCYEVDVEALKKNDFSINFNKCFSTKNFTSAKTNKIKSIPTTITTVENKSIPKGDPCETDLTTLDQALETLDLKLLVQLNNFNVRETGAMTGFKEIDLSLSSRLSKTIKLDLIQMHSRSKFSIFRKIGIFKGIIYREYHESVDKINPEMRLMSIKVSVDKKKRIYVEKIFYQFQHLLSGIGGLLKGATVMIWICIFPFREILYYKKLANEMFILCTEQKKFSKIVNMSRRGIKRSQTGGGDDKKKARVSKDGQDNLNVKHLVDKVMTLKNSFQKNGLFYNLLKSTENLPEELRRGSMIALSMSQTNLKTFGSLKGKESLKLPGEGRKSLHGSGQIKFKQNQTNNNAGNALARLSLFGLNKRFDAAKSDRFVTRHQRVDSADAEVWINNLDPSVDYESEAGGGGPPPANQSDCSSSSEESGPEDQTVKVKVLRDENGMSEPEIDEEDVDFGSRCSISRPNTGQSKAQRLSLGRQTETDGPTFRKMSYRNDGGRQITTHASSNEKYESDLGPIPPDQPRSLQTGECREVEILEGSLLKKIKFMKNKENEHKKQFFNNTPALTNSRLYKQDEGSGEVGEGGQRSGSTQNERDEGGYYFLGNDSRHVINTEECPIVETSEAEICEKRPSILSQSVMSGFSQASYQAEVEIKKRSEAKKSSRFKPKKDKVTGLYEVDVKGENEQLKKTRNVFTIDIRSPGGNLNRNLQFGEDKKRLEQATTLGKKVSKKKNILKNSTLLMTDEQGDDSGTRPSRKERKRNRE